MKHVPPGNARGRSYPNLSRMIFAKLMPLSWLLLKLLLVTCAAPEQRTTAPTARPAAPPEASPFVSAPRLEPDHWVDFEQFEPAGDGLTDDAPRLAQALRRCQETQAGLLIDPEKTYYLGTPIDHHFTGVLSIKSAKAGKQATFVLPDQTLMPLRFAAVDGPLQTAPAAEIRPGDSTLVLVNTEGLVPGDLIHIQSDEVWPVERLARKGEYNVVVGVSDTTVTLRHPCQYAYARTEKVVVTHARSATLNLIDLAFHVRDSGDHSTVAVAVYHVQRGLMDHVHLRDAQYAGTEWFGCYESEFRNCLLENANEQGQGYGIALIGGLYANVHHNTAKGCRKLCDFSGDNQRGPSRIGQALGNTAYGEGINSQGNDLFTVQSFCIATHGAADGILIQGNTAIHCQTAFQLRGINVTLDSNRVLGRCITPIALVAGRDHTVTRNVYHSQLGELSPADRETADWQRYPRGVIGLGPDLLPTGRLIIRDNRFDFVRNYGIYGQNLHQACLIENNHFDLNLLGDADPEPVLVFLDGQAAPLTDFHMRNNTWTLSGRSGAALDYQSVVRGKTPPALAPKVIDWPTCELQGVRGSDFLVFKTRLRSPVVDKRIGLKIDKTGSEVRVSGTLFFQFQWSDTPLLEGFPPSSSGQNVPFTYRVDRQPGSLQAMLKGSTGQLQLGAQAGSLGSSFAGGVPFQAVLDFGYQTN